MPGAEVAARAAAIRAVPMGCAAQRSVPVGSYNPGVEPLTPSDLRVFYDALPAEMVARFGPIDPDRHAMHRALIDPDAPEAPASPAVLNRLAAVQVPEGARVLDAGCGWGGLLLRLARLRAATGVGITLSVLQAETANAHAAAHALPVRFLAGDYLTAELGEARFDAVTCIETLIHCADKPAALARVAARLRPGGRLLLVDDMADPALQPGNPDGERFRSGWLCPSVPTAAQWRDAMVGAGLRLVHEQDLTPLYRPRPGELRTRLTLEADAALARLPPGPARAVVQGERGGLALEALYAAGLMHYRMMLATLQS